MWWDESTERSTHLWSFPDEVEGRFLMIKHWGLTCRKVRVLIEIPLLERCLSQFVKVRGGHVGGCHDQRVNTVSDIPVVVVVVSNNRQWSCLTFSLELPGATLGLEECWADLWTLHWSLINWAPGWLSLQYHPTLYCTPLYTSVQSALYTIHHHHHHHCIPQVSKNPPNWSPYLPIPWISNTIFHQQIKI